MWLAILAAIALVEIAACDSPGSESDASGGETANETPPNDVDTDSSETSGPDTSLSLDRSSFRSVIDLADLREAGAPEELPTTDVAIDDGPAYESTHRFRGWPLLELLEARADLPEDREDYAVQFVATDGYRASVPLDELPAEDGVVAFRDLGAPEGANWQPFPEDYGTSNPAPFYLVWRDAGTSDAHRPWTYKLAAIGIAKKQVVWGEAFPAHDDTLTEGFTVFRRHCMQCHAVNRSGGSVGPELNVPMNVTEYWKSPHLREYIRRPESYRADAEMPAMASELSEEDMDALLRYLEGMRRAKICSSAAECESTGGDQ